MNTEKQCEKCGAPLPMDAPGGICPKCLMELGMETGLETESGRAPSSSPKPSSVPSTQEIAESFPQLEILGYLGQGGMGIVYKARQPTLDRLVALKLLPLEAARDLAFAERFNREARALAKLSHPGIVTIYDFGQSGAYYYFLMEYVDGVNLRQLVQSGELKPAEALAIVPKICDALQYAHDEGIVHRDIKPANILLDRKGRVKIGDFGLAKLLGKAPEDYTLTGTAQVMGTPHYMAPEQISGTHAVDHRADVYSLGVVLYEMLTGELPIGHFELPSKRVQVDVRLDEVVLRTLERSPERRYQKASEVATAVESISTSKGSVSGQGAGGSGFPPGSSGAETWTNPSLMSKADKTADSEVAKQIKAPAVGLIVTGVFHWIGSITGLLVLMLLAEDFGINDASHAMVLPISGLIMLGSIVVILGGFRMMRLEGYLLSVTSSILAMVVTPGNLVGLPMGIWALVVLLRPDVKEAFNRQKAIREKAKENRRKERAAEKPAAPAFLLRWVERLVNRASPFQIKLTKAFLLLAALLGMLCFISSHASWDGSLFHLEVGEPTPWFEVQNEAGTGHSFVIQPSWAVLLFAVGYAAYYLYGLIRNQEGDPSTLRYGHWIIILFLVIGLFPALAGLQYTSWTNHAFIRELNVSEAEKNIPGLKVYRYEYVVPPNHRLRFFAELWKNGEQQPKAGLALPDKEPPKPGHRYRGTAELRLREGDTLNPDARGRLRWDWTSDDSRGTLTTGGWMEDPFENMAGKDTTWRGDRRWRLKSGVDQTLLILRGANDTLMGAPSYDGRRMDLAEAIEKGITPRAEVELHVKARMEPRPASQQTNGQL